MSTDKATKRPWLREGTTVYALEDILPDRGKPYQQNRFYAGVQGPPTTPREELEANAALIVKAINLHDELVHACEKALERLEDYGSPYTHLLKEVLAKAGDQP